MGDATARPLCSGAGYPLALSCFCHLRTELELANLRSHGPTKNQQDVHREEDAGSPAQRSRADFRRMTETPVTVSHCVAQRFLVNVVPCSASAPAPGCILVQTALTRGRKPSGIASGDRKWRHRTPRTWRASYLFQVSAPGIRLSVVCRVVRMFTDILSDIPQSYRIK